MQEYGLQLFRSKKTDIMQNVMSSDFLYGISSWTYRKNMLIRKVTLRHLRLLNVVKDIN